MSRKPPASTNARSGPPASLVRAPSSSNLSMPPPTSRMPTTSRPGSAMSSSTTRGEDLAASRAGSPTRKRVPSGEKKMAKNTISEKIGEDGEMNIQVVVRCRGRSAMEVSQRTPIICQTTGAVSSSITIETSHSAMSNMTSGLGLPVTTLPYSERAPVSKTYGFDRVFGPEADQTIVYREVVENMLDEVIAGYNCTIFAYGQTGTGKTYTMQGDISLTPLGKPVAEAGIIPRVLHRLFSLLESVPNAEFSVKCSYVELYNEELRDLLASDFHQPVALGGPGSNAQGATIGGLKIYEDANKKGGVTIQGLEESSIRNAKEGLGLLTKGSQRRQVAETKMNTESSRSHSIFSLTVHIKESSVHGGEDLLKVGKLNLVDLAGSEAIGRSGAENKRAREAGMINQSLLTLGRVISALVEKNSHVPYRESKLTRLLQDSLGGRTKTCIVATVSPTKSNMEETLSTLDYAIRAKTIRNKPEINQRLTKGTLIKDYVVEIERLKNDLSAAHEKNGIYFSAETWGELSSEHEETKNQLEDIKQRADALENKHATLTAEFESNMVMLLAREEELTVARREAQELKVEIERVQSVVIELTRKIEEERWVGEKYRKGEERIQGIAEGLKGTVVESLNDVTGLFAKIARKSDVLAANKGSTSVYSQKLSTLADRLHKDMDLLKTVQTNFGGTLQRELEALAKRGAETLEQDKAFLAIKMASFSASVERAQKQGEEDSATTLQALDDLQRKQAAVHRDLQCWITQLRVSQRETQERVVSETTSHLQDVQGSIDHISETLDVLIEGAMEQTTHESNSAKALQKVARDMHAQEIARLRTQNERLTQLLQEEQQTSTRLRNDLVSQITSLLTGFTTAQNASLNKAVSEISSANDQGVTALHSAIASYDGEADLASQRSDQYRVDLDLIRKAQTSNRADATKAVDDTRVGLTSSVDLNISQLEGQLAERRDVAERSITDMSSDYAQFADVISTRGNASRTAMDSLHQEANANLGAAKDRIVVAKEDIKVVSEAVLSAHAAAEPLFAQHCSQAQTQVDDLRTIHGDFIGSVRDDVSTGSTPRKRAWNVPSGWQTTQPREALLQRYRSNLLTEHADGSAMVNEDHMVVYQTIGEASIAGAVHMHDNSGESTATPDSIPTTPMDENMPALATAPRDSPLAPIGAALPELSDRFVPEEMQQENVPPAANFAFREITPVEVYKTTAPAVSKIQPRTGHKRSNSALTESVTTSNLPMRKTRRPA